VEQISLENFLTAISAHLVAWHSADCACVVNRISTGVPHNLCQD